MNGKVTSNVGQRVALWPVFPHEKHFTSDQLLVGAWAPVVAIVAQRSTFEAMFLAPEAQPASEGPVLSLLLPRTTVGLTCPLVIRPGPSPGEGPLESVLPTISLAVHHSE